MAIKKKKMIWTLLGKKKEPWVVKALFQLSSYSQKFHQVKFLCWDNQIMVNPSLKKKKINWRVIQLKNANLTTMASKASSTIEGP